MAASAAPKVIVRGEGDSVPPLQPVEGSPDKAWSAIAWLGMLLAVIGLIDVAVLWFPPAIGNADWEFGTVAMSFGGLPLVTMGMAGLLGAGFAQGSRARLVAGAWMLIVLAAFIGIAYMLFLTDVPLALTNAPETAQLAVRRAIIKTTVLGVGFFVAYVIAAWTALRYVYTSRRRAV